MRRFLAALRFLTVLPVPGRWGTTRGELAGSLPFFPVVGLLIGALAGALAWGLGFILPALPAAALVVVTLAAVSGGLHLDGLSDTADGCLGSRPREERLAIMRDSRAGPMGVIAVVSVLSLKLTALGSLPVAASWRAAGLMPLAGRCVLVLAVAAFPYARPDGLGSAFYEGRRWLSAAWAVLVLALAGWLAAGTAGLAAALVSILVALAAGGCVYRKIGGSTGDTLGATCEMAEAAAALALAAWHLAPRAA